MTLNLHAIEQTQAQEQRRVAGVGRPKFDFHTGAARDIIQNLQLLLARLQFVAPLTDVP